MGDIDFGEQSSPFGNVLVEEREAVCFMEEVLNYDDRAVLRILLCQERLKERIPRGTLHLGLEDGLVRREVSC